MTRSTRPAATRPLTTFERLVARFLTVGCLGFGALAAVEYVEAVSLPTATLVAK